MRGVSVKYVFALLLSCVFVATATAQAPRRSARVDSLLNPPLHKSRVLLFDKVKENLGTMHESDTIRDVVFTFRNVSDTAVVITKVTTHCGCTDVEFSKEPIPAGSSSEIIVRYNPKGREGTVDTGAFVYTSLTGRRPVAKLTLLGNVVVDDEWSHLPYVVGDLRFKRRQVVFKNGRTVARIPCANVGVEPMKLSSELLPAYATFYTEPAVLQPGDEGDMVISIKSERPSVGASGASTTFLIVVGGVEGSPSSRTIKAVIE